MRRDFVSNRFQLETPDGLNAYVQQADPERQRELGLERVMGIEPT
jgi:hypothetical protein